MSGGQRSDRQISLAPALAHRPASTPKSRQVTQPTAPAAPERLLHLQALAGNRAVTGDLQGARLEQPTHEQAIVQQVPETPTVQREVPPGRVNDAVQDLYGLLVGTRGEAERVHRTILMQKGHRTELRPRYEAKFHRSLDTDLTDSTMLSKDDKSRARCYLDYGTLRPADKIYIAINGKVTDDATVRRIVPDIARDRRANETDFGATYGKQYGTDHTLPDGSSSRIAGALMAEMISATFADRFRVAAVLAYGTPRAADDVKIATVQGFNNTDLLFDALQREDAKKIANEFEASYKSPLKEYLTRETSFHTKARALMLIDEGVKPEDRLIETVRIGTSGYTTADADFIFDAVRHATDAQLTSFRKAVAAKDPRLKSMDDTFGGMNAEQRDRLNALVGIGDNTGILGDPVVKRLRSEGGNGGDAVFDTLKNSTGPSYAAYRAAYLDEKSPLHLFVSQFATAQQKGWLLSYVFAPFKARLNYVMANPGMDDYLVFLVTSFADSAMRQQLAADSDFGAKLAQQPTATQNKVLLMFEPANMTPEERAVWLDAAVKRETASGAGSVTSNAAALADENRELQVAKERFTAGGRGPTPEQQAELDRLASKTQEALTAFVQYRDELEAAVATAVDLAVGLLVGLATGGVGSVEVVLAAAARAAVANAMARVVSQKLVRGDRFDVLGADGAAAFVTGAVDGMLNVVGPAISRGMEAAPTLSEFAGEAARVAGPSTFKQFAATTGSKMAEGAVVGSISGAVEAAAQDKTWADGFDRGMRKVVEGAAASGATGAAATAVPPAVGALVASAGGAAAFEAIIDALPDAETTLERVVLNPETAVASSTPTQPTLQRAGNYGKDFESYVDKKLWTGGLEGVPAMTFVILGAYNDLDHGIDRIGVVIDGDKIHVYHFEMKYRNLPEPGERAPKVKLEKPGLGTQGGGAWTKNAVEQLCISSHPGAIASRDAVRAMLARAQNNKPIAAVTEQEVIQFLLANLTAKRVVVVPVHVDIKRLWKQLAGMMRWGLDARVVKVKMP